MLPVLSRLACRKRQTILDGRKGEKCPFQDPVPADDGKEAGFTHGQVARHRGNVQGQPTIHAHGYGQYTVSIQPILHVPGKTHADTGRKCKLHMELDWDAKVRRATIIEPAFCCWGMTGQAVVPSVIVSPSANDINPLFLPCCVLMPPWAFLNDAGGTDLLCVRVCRVLVF